MPLISTHSHNQSNHYVKKQSTVRSRFTTIHFYDPCRVGPRTPDLWCITVATQASFLYFSALLVLFRYACASSFLFYCSSSTLIVIFPPMTSIKKTDCTLLQKGVKRTRKTLTLQTKMLVIRKMEAGEKRGNLA